MFGYVLKKERDCEFRNPKKEQEKEKEADVGERHTNYKGEYCTSRFIFLGFLLLGFYGAWTAISKHRKG